MTEDAFLRAIADDPDSAAAAWLVLADWLEGRGYPAPSCSASGTTPRRARGLAPERGTAYVLAVFILHLLGDTSAPPFFGFVSNEVGRQQAFLSFTLALEPVAVGYFVAALAARSDAARVAREGKA